MEKPLPNSYIKRTKKFFSAMLVLTHYHLTRQLWFQGKKIIYLLRSQNKSRSIGI